MSDGGKSNESPFNLQQLKQLFEMMEQHGVNTVSLVSGEERWRVNRGSPAPVVYAPAAPMPQSPPPQPVAGAVAPPTAAPAAVPDEGGQIIKSPTVGTFYVSPTPEDAAFVSVGSAVTPQTIVCIIEAMKVFNQIPAEMSGTIAAVLVKNGEAVEFGQPLFRVK